MILVIGGCSSGKKEFVKNHFHFTSDDFSSNIEEQTAVFYQLHRQDCSDPDKLLPLLRQKKVVISTEIGSGIVPIDKNQRKQREEVGRLCCTLAQEATEVYRVIAGIGQKIK